MTYVSLIDIQMLIKVLIWFLPRPGDVFVPSWRRPHDVQIVVFRTYLGRPIEVLVVFILLRIFGAGDVLIWFFSKDVVKTSWKRTETYM